MEVLLKSLKPNPYRDFTIDPIDEANVEALANSIKQDGFWGGVVCRQRNGFVEIGAGHHRVEAAIKAGIKSADVFVGNFDDASMIRVYAVENATQRGNSGTAIAGSVGSAIRFLAKDILTNGTFIKNFIKVDVASVRGNLTSERGIGNSVILEFLRNVPGVSLGTINQQLANLKASGDYARIIKEVQQAIEEEQKEALKALERAEKERKAAEERERKAEEERRAATARAKAAKEEADKRRAIEAQQRAEAEAKLAEKRRKEADEELKKFDALRTTRDTAQKAVDSSAGRKKTFDFEGVAKHLKNENQIRVFRDVVTGQGVAPYLPVENQAALAARLVALAKERKAELSGSFIKENVIGMVLNVRTTTRQLGLEERRRLEEQDWMMKARRYQDDFSRNCRGMFAAGMDILDLQKKWPKDMAPFRFTGEFKTNLRDAKKVIDKLVDAAG